MALTLPTATRNAVADAAVDLIDAGTGTTEGKLRFYTAGFATLLAELDLSQPAFGAAASGTATAATITAPAADNTGVAAVFRIVDRDDATVMEGTVGTSGADINFNSVNWTAGDTISVTSLTVTAPAS